MAQSKLRRTSSWVKDARREIESEEDFVAYRLIVLKIVRYMKDHHLSQKDLAEKLNVSPQYINKFLHGQDLDMKITTAFRYGRILGLRLLEVPGPDQSEAVWSSFVFAQMKSESIQLKRFDYVDTSCSVSSFNSCVSKGIMNSSNRVS